MPAHRHLGQRDESPTVRQSWQAAATSAGNHGHGRSRRCAFGGEIDRRRRARLAAFDLAQVSRRAEMTARVADQDTRVAVRVSAIDRGAPSAISPTRRPTGVGRIARPLLVVERYIPRRRVSEATDALPHALDRTDELPDDSGRSGCRNHVVGDCQRLGADRGQVAPALGDGLRAAARRVRATDSAACSQ